MKKKRPVSRFLQSMTKDGTNHHAWHRGGDIEIGFYARSVHKAAKTLISTLDREPNPKTAWDATPIILLYRQALELHLKSLVGEGTNFLKSPIEDSQ